MKRRRRPGRRGAIGLWLCALALACDAPPEAAQLAADAAPAQTAEAPADPDLPGVPRPDPDLTERLRSAARARGRYEPRTRHRAADGAPRYTNRLILARSPYLLQHAHNPVNWFPWSEDAFRRAKQLGRPVLLSIGYSTCHWCHVMARESFEDEEIAAYLNANYVAIKVDREERPDVDSVYLAAVALLAGRAGWPATLVLTPDGEPFFGGTYFPARDGDRGAHRGFLAIVQELALRHREDPDALLAEAREVSERLRDLAEPAPSPGLPGVEVVRQAAASMAESYDAEHGGFGGPPKFPQPALLAFLLQVSRRAGDTSLRDAVLSTLERMAHGGIHDQVGGGFHRYTTDAAWRVPHFEKMLYDNAQLVPVYLDAWALTGEPLHARVARRTLDYLAREMRSPGGGFYAATDAESPGPDGAGEEGRFFTWTLAELEAALDPGAFRLARDAFGPTEVGAVGGRNVLHLARPLDALARSAGLERSAYLLALDAARAKLYEVRARRPPPHRDEKILAAWNGLAIRAFARAARTLGDPEDLSRARETAGFVLRELRTPEGRLRRSHPSDAEAGFLEDYAFVIEGLLELYETSSEPEWLREALALQDQLDAHHAAPAGGYFTTADDHEQLIVRERPAYDGPLPSGNSVAAANLLRLALLTGEPRFAARAEHLLQAFAAPLHEGAAPRMLAALDHYHDVPLEIAVIAPTGQEPPPALLEPLRRAYLPGSVALVLDESEAAGQASRVPWLEGKRPLEGRATAFVCEQRRCDAPTADPAVFARRLAKVRRYER